MAQMLLLCCPGLSLLLLISFAFGILTVSAVNDLPAPGPCSLQQLLPPLPALAQPQRMRCTDKGYFDLVQCPGDYCVCVDPSTGAEATATRTGSNRLSPQCGRCHSQLARYHRDNSNFLFRPICEQKTGNYQPKQCRDDDHCFCVNVLNGFRLTKTEAPNGKVKCDENKFDFSIDESQVTKADEKGEQKQQIPIGNPVCKLAKDSGKSCRTGKGAIAGKGVKWYFDTDQFECLAFAYNGCGGNENRFDSVTECWDKCKLADFASCAGMRLPATNAQGHTIICAGLEAGIAQSCPSGYRCSMMAFMGVCCHSATQDLYERNYRPNCANGHQPVQMQAGGAPATLLGKKCTDEFCPVGRSCEQKEIFAHCC